MPENRQPIAIVGAGPLGLAAALALHDAGHVVEVFDSREAGSAASDARVLALSHGSRQLLEQLGAWPAMQATPISSIHISQRGALGRTLMQASEYDVPALGYVLPASALITVLATRVAERGIPIRYGNSVDSLHHAGPELFLQLVQAGEQSEFATALAVCCEGGINQNDGEEASDIKSRDYDQHALLLRAVPASPHQHIAWERFTPEGPIALLPLGTDYAVVWTVSSARLQSLLAEDDASLCRTLQATFGSRVQLASVSNRASYPLGLKFRRQPAQDRVVWLGNAAQTLHPVAGQGFNLALRDVWELADTLRDAPDPGSASLLDRYASRRRLDRLGAIGFTDSLVRLFSGANPLLTHLRGAGLFALDVLPPARHFVAKRMMFGARAWP